MDAAQPISSGFTDKWHIFADLSVNGSHFAKCSALNQCVKLSVKFTARLFSVISVIASDCHAYEKNGSDLQFETS